MFSLEHATKSFAWTGDGQARLVRLARTGVLGSVVGLAVTMAALDSHDVIGAASAVGLVLLLAGTAMTFTPAFLRADTGRCSRFR